LEKEEGRRKKEEGRRNKALVIENRNQKQTNTSLLFSSFAVLAPSRFVEKQRLNS
jgi:hypothetical protein